MGADEEGTLERLKALRCELPGSEDRRAPRPHRQDSDAEYASSKLGAGGCPGIGFTIASST
jgi:hypothetical protein